MIYKKYFLFLTHNCMVSLFSLGEDDDKKDDKKKKDDTDYFKLGMVMGKKDARAEQKEAEQKVKDDKKSSR